MTIIQGSEVDDALVAELATAKSLESLPLDHAAVWAALRVGVDPGAGIAAWEAHLERLPDPQARCDATMIFATELLGGRRHGASARNGFRTTAHLTSLFLLIHPHVRQREDIERAGKGVYSPGLRDNAQDARDSILSLLTDAPGKEAYLALMTLSELHPDESSRPWMEVRARSKATRDADAPPWTLTQVRQFADDLERTPLDHRELWELAIDRLLDLKENLEEGDGSMATVLARVEREPELRQYIGNWCRDRAHGRYSIGQEEEFADAKRPDIRFHGAGFDAPVPVELKIAEKWPGPALFERLENQLCGDYLRDTRSRRGILLLAYLGTHERWRLPDGSNVETFEALVSALQRHWSTLAPGFADIDDVRVIGIDLGKRTRVPSRETGRNARSRRRSTKDAPPAR